MLRSAGAEVYRFQEYEYEEYEINEEEIEHVNNGLNEEAINENLRQRIFQEAPMPNNNHEEDQDPVIDPFVK
ncbi:hypothetical protein PanWU01x14_277850 [Parasponia andersonii]|uniref:Uncharacterized protein n=1 Tax=Parasponia andersonii TaxID=3476 RepID=A0A2P5B2K1_PARAD|nr:hypothetical protein PanWU01x14_277850 [Parasponia andersonii]